MTVNDFEKMFDLWRAGDETASAAYFTPDGVYQEAKKEPVVGRAAIEANWKPFFHGGPEWKIDVHKIFGDGGTFAVQYTFEIKLKDGNWVKSPGCAIVTTHDGKIAEWKEYKA